MLPKALKLARVVRENEKRPKMRCLSLLYQSTRTSNFCPVVGSVPGAKKLPPPGTGYGDKVGAASQVLGLGRLHLGNMERNLSAMGLGLVIMLPGMGWRVPARGPVATSGCVGS